MSYDVAAIRKKLRQSQSGKFTDPDEFRPEKANSTTEATKYRFYILPPITAGDILKSGTVKENQVMEQFFLPHGNHWIQDKPYPCPRVWDGTQCEICDVGFDLLKETPKEDEEKRKVLVKTWMPNTYYMVNVYFPNIKMNPEELRGRVRFYNAPKTCFDTWSATLMRDDAGDPEDPQAYGIFFDENAAFLFQLEVMKHGRNNSYKTSRFVVDGGKPQPMVRNPDGTAATEGLVKLLKMRHNLFEKVEMPNLEKLSQIAKVMLEGDDLKESEAGGFDEDEVVAAEKPVAAKPVAKATAKPVAAAKPAAKPATATKPAAKPVAKVEASDADDLIDEAPLEDSPLVEDEAPVAVATKAPATTAKATEKVKETAPEPTGTVTDDEIDSLLSQLDED